MQYAYICIFEKSRKLKNENKIGVKNIEKQHHRKKIQPLFSAIENEFTLI